MSHEIDKGIAHVRRPYSLIDERHLKFRLYVLYFIVFFCIIFSIVCAIYITTYGLFISLFAIPYIFLIRMQNQMITESKNKLIEIKRNENYQRIVGIKIFENDIPIRGKYMLLWIFFGAGTMSIIFFILSEFKTSWLVLGLAHGIGLGYYIAATLTLPIPTVVKFTNEIIEFILISRLLIKRKKRIRWEDIYIIEKWNNSNRSSDLIFNIKDKKHIWINNVSAKIIKEINQDSNLIY